MNNENLELLKEGVSRIRYIRRELNDLEDILGSVIETQEEVKEKDKIFKIISSKYQPPRSYFRL